MRRLILQEFVSIDGFAADAQGTTKFFEDLTGQKGREIDNDLLTFIRTIDTILLGANTYKMFVDFWPAATTDQEPVADALNATPKIVFSEKLKQAPWGKWDAAKIVNTDAVTEIKRLKTLPGKDMVLWGSISLAQSLLKENVIDEIQLRVCPVALGKGRELFPKNESKLKLIDTKTYAAGVVLMTYRPE